MEDISLSSDDGNKQLTHADSMAAKHNDFIGNSNAVNSAYDDNYQEKQKLISQIIELQHTLEDLSSRVETVKEENMKLRSENQILGQYNENLMNASSVFHTNSPKTNRRS